MYQANQRVINQNANISLIGIRQMEINYFANFFANFGTQCFFLTAMLAGSVSQTPSFQCGQDCNRLWQYIYNISVSICMSLSAIELLISVFIAVYAQGLAIRGREGSMIEAIMGMIHEQSKIVQYFMVSVTLFQIQLLAMFFLVADRDFSMACGCVIAVMGYYTFSSALRIYNRFKWDFSRSGWNYDRDDNAEKEISELTPDLLQDIMQRSTVGGSKSSSGSSRITASQIQEAYRESIDSGVLKESDSASKKKKTVLSMLNNAFGKPKQKGKQKIKRVSISEKTMINNDKRKFSVGSDQLSDVTDSDNNHNNNQQQRGKNTKLKTTTAAAESIRLKAVTGGRNRNDSLQSDHSSVSSASASSSVSSSSAAAGPVRGLPTIQRGCEGCLLVYIKNPNKSVFNPSKHIWIKYYFILRDSYLYYYENESAFKTNPSQPINSRPIDLEGYQLVQVQTTPLPPFPFSIKPIEKDDIRKTWQFRCENIDGYQYWTEKISDTLSKINPS
jgi:hypothetical protein